MNKFLSKYRNLSAPVKASFWFLVCSMLQQSLSLITTPIFTRLLTVEQYSQYSVYTSWMQIFTMITTLRLNYGVFNKGMSKYGKNRDEYTVTMQTLTSIITLTVFGVYVIFNKQINDLTELSTFIMCAMFIELFFTPAITFWTLRQRYEYIYKSVIFVTLGISIVNMAVGIIGVVVSDEKGIARILSCVFSYFIFGIFVYAINIKKGKGIFYKEYAKFALLFNLPLIPYFLSTYILSQSDRIMIQKLDSKESVALYSVVYNAAMIMQIVTESINSSLVPSEYRAMEDEKHEKFGEVLKPILLFISIVLSAAMICAPEIIQLLAGDKYASAVYVMPPVVASVFFIFIFQMYGHVEFYYDQNKFTAYISMVGAVLNIVLNYIFIKMYGYVAAAYTTLACYIIFAFLHYLFVKSLLKKNGVKKMFDSKFMLIISVVLFAITICTAILYQYRMLRYGFGIILLLIIFIKRKSFIQIVKNVMSKKMD